ncbi:MAG: hypothetical protein AAGB31_07790 [Bdellovibrio sp.]
MKENLSILIKIGLSLLLVSCKVPASVESEDSAFTSLEKNQQQIYEHIVSQIEADALFTAQEDVWSEPFLNYPTHQGTAIQWLEPSCVESSVVEETDILRHLSYEYVCEALQGSLVFVSEKRESSVESSIHGNLRIEAQTDVIWNSRFDSQQVHLSAGMIQVDKEFTDSWQEEVLHSLSGATAYDFIPDTIQNIEGQDEVVPQEGYFNVTSTIQVTANGASDGVVLISTEGLHIAKCGIDEGTLLIRSASGTLTVTFNSCGSRIWNYSASSK